MNKLFVTLLGASTAALVLAIGCGTWLFLESWEEGKKLERQNRELLASLEASRIRLENFCEYPAEALCNVETPQGNLSDVMGNMAVPAPQNAPVPEPQPLRSEVPAEKTDSAAPAPSAPVPSPAPLPTVQSLPASVTSDTASAPSRPEPVQKEAESASGTGSEQSATPEVPAPAPEPAKVSPTAAPEKEQPQDISPEKQAKKTWISLETAQNGMKLRIAGAGSSLTAQGRLLQDPLRYDVTLNGLWKIYNKKPETGLVRGLQIRFDGNNTLLSFSLSAQPEHCSVEQEDPRTIAISIR